MLFPLLKHENTCVTLFVRHLIQNCCGLNECPLLVVVVIVCRVWDVCPSKQKAGTAVNRTSKPFYRWMDVCCSIFVHLASATDDDRSVATVSVLVWHFSACPYIHARWQLLFLWSKMFCSWKQTTRIWTISKNNWNINGLILSFTSREWVSPPVWKVNLYRSFFLWYAILVPHCVGMHSIGTL